MFIRLIVSAGVSFIVLALLIHLVSGGMSQGERPQILTVLFNTSLTYVGCFIVMQLCSLFFRSWRYKVLIKAGGEQTTPSLRQMIMITGVRNMLVDLIPARIGELSYIAMLNRGYRVSLETGLSSLTISIVFDFIALLAIIILVFIAQIAVSELESWAMIAIILISLVVSAATFCLFVLLPKVDQYLTRKKYRVLERPVFRKATELLSKTSSAIEITRHSGELTKVFGLSLLTRCFKYGGLYLLFMGVALPSFSVIASASYGEVLSALVGAEIGASLPIPALMSFGTYEAGGTLMFSMLGLDAVEGLVVLLSTHIWSQSVDYTIGGICLVLFFLFTRFSAGSFYFSLSSWKSILAVSLAGLLLIGGLGFLALEYRSMGKRGAFSPPSVGVSVRDAAIKDQSVNTFVHSLNGFILWSSNRFGNHDILKMELPGGKVSQVTTHPHTETYPRISPDGKQIVFARSHQPWVSQRNTIAWDVYWKSLVTGEEKKIASHATFPSWADNQHVVFLQNAVETGLYNIHSGETQVIYQSGRSNSMPQGANIFTPSINLSTGQLVFTGRQSEIGMQTGFWGTALMGPDFKIHGMLDGCEVTWSMDRNYLYQVGHGGKQKTMFYRINPSTLQSEPWLDLPGDFSHEYFPKDSNDGQILIFGASQGGHEHDTADYEIFLWPIGSDVKEVQRLTFHTGNDNWPDIHITH